MTKEGSTKIVNIMTLGAGVFKRGHISQIVKMHSYSFKIFSTPRYRWYSNDDQGRIYQNCEFHDPRGWDLMLISHSKL